MLNKEDISKFLYDLVSIESESGNELVAVKFVAEKISELGFRTSLEYIGESSANLIINDSKQPELLVATHIDTVPIVSKPRLSGELVFGTGAVDAKGSIASLYYSLSIIDDLSPRVSIAIFSQEETSGGGAISYLRTHKPNLALILEPTNLKLSNRSFGYLEVLFSVDDEHYHPDLISHEKLSNTSIERSLSLLNHIKQFSILNDLTYTITSINADGGEFFVPNSCRFIVNFHIPPGKKPLVIYRSLEDFLKKINLSFRDNYYSLRIIDFANPFETEISEHVTSLFKAYEKIFGNSPKLIDFRSWSDANTFYDMGIPSYIFGPGDPSLAHNDKEHVNISDVILAGKFIKELLNEFI